MLRSVIVKGTEALLLECVTASERLGVTEHVLRSLDEDFPEGSWRDRATYLLGRTPVHATRRAREMEEVAQTVHDAGVAPYLSKAAAAIQDWRDE